MKKFIVILIVLLLAGPAFAGLSAVNNYNTGTAPFSYHKDPGLSLTEGGVLTSSDPASKSAMLLPAPHGFNIIENPSFEQSSSTAAAYWEKDIKGMQSQYDLAVAGNAHSGKKCLAIKGTVAGSGRWYNEDAYLVGGVKYHLSCWVKAAGDGVVGRISFPAVRVNIDFDEKTASDWTRIDADFVAGRTDREAIFLLVNSGVGTVYFDDISIKITKPLRQGVGGLISRPGAKPITAIVIQDDCTITDYYLAFEVQRVLKVITGQELVIVSPSVLSLPTGGIYINCAPKISLYTAALASVNDEGIVLDVNSDNIICLGNTPRGVYYAVQEFLYQLGCRWYSPWDDGECLPSTFSIANKKIMHDPDFSLRGGAILHAYHIPPAMDLNNVDFRVWWEWAARNRSNILRAFPGAWDPGAICGHGAGDFSGHTIDSIIKPSLYWSTHPEYFIEVNGARTTQTPWNNSPSNVCVSNTNVVDLVVNFVNDYFTTHPHASRVLINQMDGGAQCECDSCKALDPPGSVNWDSKTSTILIFTDRWLNFVNRIADKVVVSHPNKYVGTWAYSETLTVPVNPANNPHNNVMIELTWSWEDLQARTWESVRCFKHDLGKAICARNAAGLRILDNWDAITSAPVSIYSYYMYYNDRGTSAAYCQQDASFYRTLYNKGVRDINDEFGADALSAPLLLSLRARLLWDINTDVKQYIDDFCAKVYGPAAGLVKQYFSKLESSVYECPKTDVTYSDYDPFTPDVLSALSIYLDKAMVSAGDDTTLQARIARLQISLYYTKIKTYDPVIQADAIDVAQAAAYKLIQKYKIPIMTTVWPVLAP